MVKKSDFKNQIRNEAKRIVPGARYGTVGHKAYREAVEKGRSSLLLKSNEGGDSPAKRIKQEIIYLLNNYLPCYDDRIEHLIDSWRTSGDPSYDPGIRNRLRQARREHMEKSNPF